MTASVLHRVYVARKYNCDRKFTTKKCAYRQLQINNEGLRTKVGQPKIILETTIDY